MDRQLNPAAFAIPSLFAYGNITPNEATVRTFPWPNEDMSLLKEWQLHESWNLTFRADFFNIFNRHVFGENGGAYAAANDYVGGAGFGMFGGTINSPRIIQFGLKLKW